MWEPNTADRMAPVVAGSMGKRLMYHDLTA